MINLNKEFKKVDILIDNSDIDPSDTNWEEIQYKVVSKMEDLKCECIKRRKSCEAILGGCFILTLIFFALFCFFFYKIYACAIIGNWFCLLWASSASLVVTSIYGCSELSKVTQSSYYSLSTLIKKIEAMVVSFEKSDEFNDELFNEFKALQLKASVALALVNSGIELKGELIKK